MTKTTVKVWTGWGCKADVTLTIDDDGFGVLDEAARRAFMRGQCHSLALAIHELTGAGR